MNTMLVINASPALEEDLVDYLLSHPAIEGFTSFAAHGHGTSTAMSVTEQVTGRRKRIQFQIIMSEQDVAAVTRDLGEQIGADILFWQIPVSGVGRT